MRTICVEGKSLLVRNTRSCSSPPSQPAPACGRQLLSRSNWHTSAVRLSYIPYAAAVMAVLGGAGIAVACGPGVTIARAETAISAATHPRETSPEAPTTSPTPSVEPLPAETPAPVEPPAPTEPTAPVEPVPPEVQQPQPAPRPVPPPRRPATPTTPSTPPAPAPAPAPEPEPEPEPEQSDAPEPAPEPSTESPSPEPFVFDQIDGPESENWRPQLAIVTLAGSVGLVALLFAARWAMRQEWFRSLGERVGIRRR